MGEALSRTARTIDPLNTLLHDDLTVFNKKIGGNNVRIINILLKSTKESRADFRGVKIEVFETKTELCPVAALLWYRKLLGKTRGGSAAYRVGVGNDGTAYRYARFNTDLKLLLSSHICYGRVSTHSFRIGLASLMATRGFSDSDIQAAGRWSSDCFHRYIRLPRLTRCRTAAALAA